MLFVLQDRQIGHHENQDIIYLDTAVVNTTTTHSLLLLKLVSKEKVCFNKKLQISVIN